MKQSGLIHRHLSRNTELIILFLLALFIFALALISPVTYASGDSHFSLIVSQSILEHGTIHLDAYQEINPTLFEAFDYQVSQQNGHWLYNYPSGSSLFSLPFVGIALIAGSDMLVVGDNHLWQNVISALVVAVVFLSIYRIARAYLAAAPSLIITVVTVLGSTLISTLSTALWNLGFSVLFISLGLGYLAWYDSGRSRSVHPYWLGLLLFAAYLSRPSASFFILIVFIYLAIKDRGSLLRTGVVSFSLLILFLVFSRLTYGSWLPTYYSAGAWLNPSGYLKALYGVLLSPSRGFLIYSPFLLLVVGGFLLTVRRGQQRLLFWLSALWVGLQVTSVAATRMWWGGYSFGPRLLTDALPALVLMTAILWRDLAPRLNNNQRRAVIAGYCILGLLAMFINSYVGLFNVKNPLWNAYPSIDQYPEYLYDWDYPQFLVTNRNFHERRLQHHQRQLEKNPDLLEPYRLGQTLSITDDPLGAIFSGWWVAEVESAWTEVVDARVLFVPDAVPDEELQLTLTASAFGYQPVDLFLNEQLIGQVTVTGENESFELPLDGRLLRAELPNELKLTLPEARNPSFEELARLGIRYAPHRLGLRNLTIQFLDESGLD